ncbi:hypothetical protein R50073_46300 [Maricurvus nonylphenolicus]|uniref:phosphodiesterase n=1 Tax=Maricurvus nonylphenolicus TaxID=1008307 RepID=UPI0036F29112
MSAPHCSRRDLLKLGLGSSALAFTGCSIDCTSPDTWDKGDIQHILPTVSHRAFNIKVSFHQPCNTPTLRIGETNVTGAQQDSAGRFWAFRINNLQPDTQYALQLFDKHNNSLCAQWPLKTFPAPTAAPQNLRVISYTCAGGPDLPVLPGGRDAFKPVAYRQKLYDLMLEQKPDLVIANGDHIYWDYRSWLNNRDGALSRMAMKYFLQSYGTFDQTQAVKGTANETTLQAVADEQIGRTYGVRFRSTPIFFITDDHDYFDNDDATPELVTFPPNNFHAELRNLLQAQYFPEYIVEETLPDNFPGQKQENNVKLSTHFGGFQYGQLLLGLVYDCGGQLTLNGDHAGLVPETVENWLIEKTQSSNSQHLIHFPSHPMGWSAGKWREWYPDTIDSEGTLLADVHRDRDGNKYMWQQGWWLQHQRLLQTIHSQPNRKPIVVSGDLHLLGSGVIEKSGDLDLSENPVHTILSGPVGVGGLGWLSKARGLQAKNPGAMEVDELLPPQETNGFTLLEISPNKIEVNLMACPKGYIDPTQLTVTPAHQYSV